MSLLAIAKIRWAWGRSVSQIKPVVIIDIDNTIISQYLRKKLILSHILKREITIEEVRRDFSLNYIFENFVTDNKDREILIKKFQDIFFKKGYFTLDAFEIIEESNTVLRRLNEHVDIYYVSARTHELYTETKDQLEQLGFPIVDEERNKLFLLNEEEELKLHDFKTVSQTYKSKIIKEIIRERDVVAAIGDTPDDICAFHCNGILSILYKNYYDEKDVITALQQEKADIDYYSFIELKRWSDIECYIYNIIGKGKSLKDIRERDISDYSKWLFDLDHKAMLLLVVGTFCATTIFNLIADERMQGLGIIFNSLALLGLIFSILAILLSIRSFGSKRTRGINSSHNFSIRDVVSNYKQSLNHLVRIILGQRVIPPFSPVEDKVRVYNSNYKRFAYLKHYNKLYDTVDGEDIETIKFFDIKSANYAKLYPETFARVFIFCTLGIIFIMALLYFVTNISNLSNTQTKPSVQHVEAYHSQNSYHVTPYQIPSNFFDATLTKVTENGNKKLRAYYNQVIDTENKRMIITFNTNPTENDLERSIQQLKIQIQEQLIVHTLLEINPKLEIIIIN